MGRITLAQAAAWCGGQVDPRYADITFLGASHDSRQTQPGQLFVALQSARDGHDFIPAALEKGAAAVLCSRTADDRFPGSFDAVCAAGLLSDSERQSRSFSDAHLKQGIERRSRDLLLIRAAEDALRAHLSGEIHGNAAHGALYVCPTDQMPQELTAVCLHTGKFVFFR